MTSVKNSDTLGLQFAGASAPNSSLSKGEAVNYINHDRNPYMY